MKTNVFISGGGIGGLTLGLKLARCNIDVTIVERLPGPGSVYKGELLQPKSLEIFDSLGVIDDVFQNGHSISDLELIELRRAKSKADHSTMSYSILPTPYPFSLMIHHETLKDILRQKGEEYPSFHYRANTVCKKINGHTVTVEDRETKAETEIHSDFIIGAEGRSSVTRDYMEVDVKEKKYNHHFLTITFPRPKEMVKGRIISTYQSFLGLFPLPDDEVRSVYLIPAGEYKTLRKKPISEFHKLYIEMCPDLDGYVNQIEDWKKIQLMVPLKYHAETYVKDHFALIGDAVHTVHPMAGEGMNMAIQDGSILGELLCDMYKEGKLDPANLEWYPKVRKKRVAHQMHLSHLSALVYSYPYRPVGWLRNKSLQRMERDSISHYKQMLNISGLGMWRETLYDRMIQGGVLPIRHDSLTDEEKSTTTFTENQDYPWKGKEALQ
ncbi:FAD-dependent oxidoreductase [Rossellomorea vietnamensis]|uniref:FAD-dependent oxidoreductase n=1 Tax=Rossellomorea vietnamensis TaxID=218284 RepID=UPI001E32EE26|nr:NAD(P)/FAD-dependent oxidoreductase [Rossellomorea vietnamensis]MCC5804614.1 FAD-dependent monooxygenase [Rossellomorea vietnamensis]